MDDAPVAVELLVTDVGMLFEVERRGDVCWESD
jgi:hypothetical protein